MEEQIKATIASCYTHVSDAYDKLEEMGATMPVEKNIENLRPTVLSLPLPPQNNWGILYSTEYPAGIALTEEDWESILPMCTGSTTFSFGTIQASNIFGITIGNKPTSLPQYFFYGLTLSKFDGFPPNITKIGNYSFYNGNISVPLHIPSNIEEIGNSFCRGATVTQPITIDRGITWIGSEFMNRATYNHPITFPGSLEYIWDNCLSLLSDFNSKVTIEEGVKEIKSNFLLGKGYDSVFNQSITFPSSLVELGFGFLKNNSQLTSQVTFNCPSSSFSATTNDQVADTMSIYYNAAPCYVSGIPIGGTYASQWRTALPNSNVNPFRKLI